MADDEIFDFSGMVDKVIDEEPEAAAGKKRKYEVNPFDKKMAEAVKVGKGKEVTFPAKMVPDASMLIRQAAKDMGLATKIRYYHKGNRIIEAALKDLHPQANVTIKYWPAPKRTRTPQNPAPEATPETPAEEAVASAAQ